MSASLFRVILNGTTLENEPFGLNKARIKIVRDKILKGIFVNYVTNITFWGDGYAALLDAAEDCDPVSCIIQYRCNETDIFETLFEGVIPIGSSDVEWDEYNCNVTTKVENSDFSNFIQRYKNYKVPYTSGFCIDGSTVLPPLLHGASFLPADPNDISNTSLALSLSAFTTTLQYVISFLSNNQITVDFDPLYTTLQRPQILEVVPPAAVNGDVLTLSFTNFYNQNYTVSHVCADNGGAGDWQDLSSKSHHITPSSPTGLESDRSNYFEKASLSVSNYPSEINIRNLLPWKNVVVSNATSGVSGSVTETQSWQLGYDLLMVMNSTTLQNQYQDSYISLNDLLRHATEMHNMGYRFEKTGTGYTLILRTNEELLTQTPQVFFDNVANIRSKTAGIFSVDSMTTADGKSDGSYIPVTYSTGTCYGEQGKIDGKNFSSQDFWNALNSNNSQQGNDIMFVFEDAVINELEFRQFDATLSSPTLNYHYTISYMNAVQLYIYGTNTGGKTYLGSVAKSIYDSFSLCTNCPTAEIDNISNVALTKEYTFRARISMSQIQTLLTGEITIGFSGPNMIAKTGPISEIEIGLDTFMATVQVYG